MKSLLAGKKLLFATVPADGHVNPLTGLAVYLKSIGCDVRWYTSESYRGKIERLDIPLYTLKKALDIAGPDFAGMQSERDKKRSQVAKLRFDLINVFISRAPEYFEDMRDIYRRFPFDLVVMDCAFGAMPYVKDIMKIPVISVGVLPLIQSSKYLAPVGLGLMPGSNLFIQMKHAFLRAVADRLIFGKPNKVMFGLFDKYGVLHNGENVFDMSVVKSDLFLQSGTPGFEYNRKDISGNVRFIGSLLPYKSGRKIAPWTDSRLVRYRKILLVTQGTVEKNVNKIIVPVLEAYKGTDVLVIATTGGTDTAALKKRFRQGNLIIEDFIPFDQVMPYAHLYITNGGYGGVLMAIAHQLPIIVAGVHEGKNEIAARIGYFGLGINLKTETPSAMQIMESVSKVLADGNYKSRVSVLAKQFSEYDPNSLFEKYAVQLLRSHAYQNLAAIPAV